MTTRQLCIDCQGQGRVEEEASEQVYFQQDCSEVGYLGLVRRCLGPRNSIPLDGLCRYNQPAFRGRGAKYRCREHVRGLGRHVGLHSKCRAGRPSQPTLRVEALSPGNLPTKPVSWASGNLTFHAEVQITGSHILNLSTNSKVRSGTGGRHEQYADGSLEVHPVTSENIPGRTWVVVLDPEWQQNPTVYARIDEGSLLDSSGNFLAGLGNLDFNVVVVEQVLVPDGTVTFPAGGVRTMTTMVISFTVSVALAERNTSSVSLGEKKRTSARAKENTPPGWKRFRAEEIEELAL